MKLFTEITTDAEYLRAVGMGPDECPEWWRVRREEYPDGKGYWEEDWCDASFCVHNPDPANKWRDFANVLEVLGPEMDRRGWRWTKTYWGTYTIVSDPPEGVLLGEAGLVEDHLAVLEAFYNAHHAQGDAE